MSKLRTYVTFSSDAFNVSEPREYFINPTCFGDDAAKWLIGRLRRRGISVTEAPRQEDFGWYVTFQVDGVDHDFVMGYRQGGLDEAGVWIGWLERKVGLVRSLLGGRRRGISRAAAEALHVELAGSSEISHVRWHYEDDFRSGREGLGAERPGPG